MEPLPPTILVIFGATGDLFGKKIVPALHRLFEQKRLPRHFTVVGFGRRALSDTDFQKMVATQLVASGREASEGFSNLFSYVQGNFDEAASFQKLGDALSTIDTAWGVCAGKMFYLAVPPELFGGLLKNLAESGVSEGCGPGGESARILIEKPFGSNEEGARALNEYLKSLFSEEQIYRIDHYLAKTALRALPDTRKKFPALNSLLMGGGAKRISIKLLESNGAEGRGTFYDRVGAFRDMGQNHMVVILSLLGMSLADGAAAFRQARAAFVTTLPRPTPAEIQSRTRRAQYEGYRTIDGVAADSMTETYFKIATTITNGVFAGAELVLESGKRMGVAEKSVAIDFGNDSVRVELEPEIKIQLNGEALYAHTQEQGGRYAAEYAELFADAMRSDQQWFLTAAEVEAAWHFADPVVAEWQRNTVPLETYVADHPTDILKE